MTGRLFILFGCFLASLTGCTTPPPGPQDLTAQIGRSHILTGKIWDTKAQRFISPQDLAASLAQRDILLLGEQHDNPDHHKLQAWLIQALADRNRTPAVAFEMIGTDKAAALRLYQETDRHNADGLDVFLDWNNSGWPAFATYKPVFDAALFNGQKIAAANLPPAVVKDMAAKGRAALPPALARSLNLPDTIPEPLKQAIASDVREAHCNKLPESLILPFVDIQYSRDALMAQSLLASDEGKGALLIAGAGHVRNDRGVPWHLHRIAPKKTVAALAFTEVEEDKLTPASYAAEWNAQSLPFEYVWFTARAGATDPCAALLNKFTKLP